jgi:Mg/Co/Ni transporter MgtE
VTCSPRRRIADTRPRVDASPYGFVLVTSPGGTLLGRLGRHALGAARDASAQELMEPGPSTIRADTTLAELRDRLDKHDLSTAVITTPEGVLLGVVRRDDLPAG